VYDTHWFVQHHAGQLTVHPLTSDATLACCQFACTNATRLAAAAHAQGCKSQKPAKQTNAVKVTQMTMSKTPEQRSSCKACLLCPSALCPDLHMHNTTAAPTCTILPGANACVSVQPSSTPVTAPPVNRGNSTQAGGPRETSHERHSSGCHKWLQSLTVAHQNHADTRFHRQQLTPKSIASMLQCWKVR
jgi:hypothetical protein